jgi:deoxyribonuclease-4
MDLMHPMRVRQILDGLGTPQKAELKKLLPAAAIKAIPTVETQSYPSALLSVFPASEKYAWLGVICEEVLRIPSVGIGISSLLACVKKWFPDISEAALEKVRTSKTTVPFVEACKATRKEMESSREGSREGSRKPGSPFKYNCVLSKGFVEGHPDILTTEQVFEVKLTGQLGQNWLSFLFQVFAYAAMCSETVKEVVLVLPLQRTVWRYPLVDWNKRVEYHTFFDTQSKKIQQNLIVDVSVGTALRELYNIGFHAGKQKLLAATVERLPDERKPYQIFLGNAQSSKMSFADDDIAAAAGLLEKRRLRLFVHTQYIINLCAEDGWGADLLAKNAQVAAALGCRGVVVHVGKSVGKELPVALESMRTNLSRALTSATASCPILLETPAGQGTETLTEMDEFIDFVASFADDRLQICVDTCHTFACGHQPLDYIKKITDGPRKSLLKLIHYNDSAEPCGCRKDRHAFMGTGHIGMEMMGEIAKHCHEHHIPMLIE